MSAKRANRKISPWSISILSGVTAACLSPMWAAGQTIATQPRTTAQPTAAPRPLAVGQQMTGRTIDTSDPRTEAGNYYESYALHLEPHQTVELRMSSPARLNCLLQIGLGEGGTFAALGGGRSETRSDGLCSYRLIYTARQTGGDYIVRAIVRDGGTGEYGLEAKLGRIVPPPQPKDIALDQTVRGQLDLANASTGAESLYELYSFAAQAGERYRIDVASRDFRPRIEVSAVNMAPRRSIAPILGEPVSGDGFTSGFAIINSSGPHLITVRSRSATDQGAFTVKLHRLPTPMPAEKPVNLTINKEYRGSFSENSPVIDDVTDASDARVAGFKAYRLFTIRRKEGERLLITMKSDKFDGMLEAGAISPSGFAAVDVGDPEWTDNGDTQLRVGFKQSGMLVIRASALNEGSVGSFTLKAELDTSAPKPVLPDPPPVTPVPSADYAEANAFAARGNQRRNAEDFSGAIADFNQSLKLRPGDAGTLNSRCWTRATWGQELPLALADCEESLRLRPNDSNTLDSRGLVLLRMGNLPGALMSYEAAFKARSSNVSARYGYGVTLFLSGKKSEGRALIEQAKTERPGIVAEYQGYGVKLPE